MWPNRASKTHWMIAEWHQIQLLDVLITSDLIFKNIRNDTKYILSHLTYGTLKLYNILKIDSYSQIFHSGGILVTSPSKISIDFGHVYTTVLVAKWENLWKYAHPSAV